MIPFIIAEAVKSSPKIVQVAPVAKPIPEAVVQTAGQTAGQTAVAPVPEKMERFGVSVQGRSLIAYVLGNGPNVTLVFGAFHGNEPSTPGVVKKLRVYLKQHPAYLQGCRVVLAPVVNPDGLRARTRLNGHGVDINRNFKGTWKPKSAGVRFNPGPHPGSEPETQAVMRLMDKYRPAKVISLHQPYHVMNWTGENSRELAGAMQKKNGYRITDDIGYPTPGSYGSYCGKVKGIPIITLELSNASAAASWAENKDALLAAIQYRFDTDQQEPVRESTHPAGAINNHRFDHGF